MKARRKKQKTIKFAELKRLSFCNSPRLPKAIAVGGMRREWVGIGWIDVGPLRGDETLVVE